MVALIDQDWPFWLVADRRGAKKQKKKKKKKKKKKDEGENLMPVLTNDQRRAVWALFMSVLSRRRASLSLTKGDLRSVVDALDQWLEDNQASFNQAIPLPARTVLTAKQKVELFKHILDKKVEVD